VLTDGTSLGPWTSFDSAGRGLLDGLRLIQRAYTLTGWKPLPRKCAASRYHGSLDVNQVTQMLMAVQRGDAAAAEKVLPLVYDELRRLAAQRLAAQKPGQTLQPTALVHEAYLRLVDVDNAQRWDGRGHFFAAAAEAMRRILVEKARRRQRVRHGGGLKRVDLDKIDAAVSEDDDASADQLAALDQALTQLESQGSMPSMIFSMTLRCGARASS
jgi:RNA polymerase sigma factor (TIGR02999 family)